MKILCIYTYKHNIHVWFELKEERKRKERKGREIESGVFFY